MPSAQVTSYTAHVGRLGELGEDRLIVLSHVVVDGETRIEGSSEIYFADRFEDNGFSTLGAADLVRAHLPSGMYVEWIDLLRHEAPVYLHWTHAEQAGERDSQGIIHLSTGPEPPGEGPTDHSL